MKLYNIEAIKGDKFNLYELYNNDNYPSDILLLRDFFRTLSNIKERGIGSGKAYLNAFYTYYVDNGGDARYWLNRTIENISVYPDVIIETWLDAQLKNLTDLQVKKFTARDIIRDLMPSIKEQTKLGITVDTVLKDFYTQVIKDHPNLKWGAFRKAYYDIDRMHLGK